MGAPAAAPVESLTLTLFIAGEGRRSRESILRAQRLADRFDQVELRVIDVLDDPGAAESALVLVVPSLVVRRRGRRDQIVVGDLPPASELAEHLGLAAPTPRGQAVDHDRAISRIWESNPDGIIVTDADGTVCYLNDAGEALLGRTAADLIGTSLDFHLAAEGPTELEIPRGGRISTVEIRTAATSWEGRDAVMATLRDVTEKKAMVDELQRTRAELVRSNEDLERFAAIAAHDLKAPLGIIAGAAGMLGEIYGEAAGADGKALVDAITRSVARMATLLDAVLEAAHAGADLDLQPTDLGALVRDVASVLRPQIEEVGATLDVRPLPTVLVDATQMSLLFQNLIANAVKYRSSERPLRIDVFSEETDGGFVVTVRDNGIGIEVDDRERVFTMLDRLPSGRHQADGHGIGLSTCRRVVERHGGHIWVDGSADGTSFRFSIPSARPAPGS